MRVGLISDVHANITALETVLEDMPAVDRIVHAGDAVGYNAWPAECVETLRDRGIDSVMGNHDRKVAHRTNFERNRMAQAGIQKALADLAGDDLAWIDGLPETLTCCDGRVQIVHGHPDDPDRYTYPDEFAPGLLGDEDVLVLGHTHVQHAEQFGEGIVVNPGSVGQPRDNDPRAGYAVVDLDALTVETHRVEYDIDAVAEGIVEAGLPQQSGERLKEGR